jgi:hypothetical protein
VSKPIAELTRNATGLPVLGLYNLTPENIEALRIALLFNGQDLIHTLRSEARAHVEYWNPEDSMVGVALHSGVQASWLFIHAVCNGLGISSGRIPDTITDSVPN